MTVSSPPVDWLLETGDAWVQARTRTDLLGQPHSAPDVQAARAAMLADPRARRIVDTLQDWPGPPLSNHKTAGHHLHLLSFLAETGMRLGDPGIDTLVEHVLAHQAEDGAFQIVMQIKESYGGTDQPTLSWALCDAPLVLYALCAMGVRDNPRIGQAVAHLSGQIRDNGWPCASGPNQGFRGPGRKGDPCPYANLLALKALAAYGAGRDDEDEAVKAGIAALLWHWDIQLERKVYMFGIGTDFRKPKFPLVWYDILHVGDVLSRFPTARRDPRFQAMLAELMDQADAQGRFTPASMYRDWKEWEFADKKNPSPAITLIAWQAALRATGDVAA
jgi:hypothetical protein